MPQLATYPSVSCTRDKHATHRPIRENGYTTHTPLLLLHQRFMPRTPDGGADCEGSRFNSTVRRTRTKPWCWSGHTHTHTPCMDASVSASSVHVAVDVRVDSRATAADADLNSLTVTRPTRERTYIRLSPASRHSVCLYNASPAIRPSVSQSVFDLADPGYPQKAVLLLGHVRNDGLPVVERLHCVLPEWVAVGHRRAWRHHINVELRRVDGLHVVHKAEEVLELVHHLRHLVIGEVEVRQGGRFPHQSLVHNHSSITRLSTSLRMQRHGSASPAPSPPPVGMRSAGEG
mmetsp:Transcript_14680/g.35006  ORF Transcript_14680/g.35006 Transcript_14680/m.35006 type:complete len:289 (+) Transcript_14680:487-1353(+)